jgi:hypothetical protein
MGSFMKRVSALRNVPARKSLHVFLAGAMAVAGSLLAASAPASAAGSSAVCESSGHHYCIGAPKLGRYDAVVETVSGRFLNINSVSGGVELQFAAETSLCVAAGNGGVVVVQHPCNGGLGVVWVERPGSNGHYFENREFGKYLSGANRLGSQYEIKNKDASGWDQQFTVSGV